MTDQRPDLSAAEVDPDETAEIGHETVSINYDMVDYSTGGDQTSEAVGGYVRFGHIHGESGEHGTSNATDGGPYLTWPMESAKITHYAVGGASDASDPHEPEWIEPTTISQDVHRPMQSSADPDLDTDGIVGPNTVGTTDPETDPEAALELKNAQITSYQQGILDNDVSDAPPRDALFAEEDDEPVLLVELEPDVELRDAGVADELDVDAVAIVEGVDLDDIVDG